MHVFDLKTGKYERVQGKGDIPEPRVGHVAGVIDGDIYVFGGVRCRVLILDQAHSSEEAQR